MKNIKIHFLLILVILISACGGLTEKQKKSVEDSISALNKLEAATDIGISKSEYSRMLIDAIPVVTKANESLPDGDLKQEIKITMDAYLDAKELWDILKDDSSFYVMCSDSPPQKEVSESVKMIIELSCDPKGKILRDKYNLTVRDPKTKEIKADKSGEIFKKEAISIIWETAKKHLDRVSSITKGI